MQKNAGEDDLDHPDTSGSPILKIPKDNSPAKKGGSLRVAVTP
jgi:hypothetical protein